MYCSDNLPQSSLKGNDFKQYIVNNDVISIQKITAYKLMTSGHSAVRCHNLDVRLIWHVDMV